MLRTSSLRIVSIAALTLLVACDEGSESPPDGGGPRGDASASSSCVGAGACAGLDEAACSGAEFLGLGCTRTVADVCLFGDVDIGAPADPGCSSRASGPACVGLSNACRWTGSSCVFKNCRAQTTEGGCAASGCVFFDGGCYDAACPALDAAGCQATFGCGYWTDRFVGCSGTLSCSALEPPVGTDAKSACESVAASGLPCAWVP